jgi:hypothetical protein
MPFEHVSLYLITGIRECDGYDAVVVFVCMLTKRTIVEPITKTITAEQLTKVMHRVVFRHFGLPRKLISDRDPRFMSDFWQTLFRVIGTKLNISTSYHPQTYGQTEQVNQTWEQVIRCYVHPLHNDWVQHLTNVEFAINAAVSTSTLSPFKTTVGFEPTSPTTATFEDNEPNRTLPEQVKILVEMHSFSHDFVKAAQEHMQEVANRHQLPVPFTVGDKVKLKATNLRFVQQPSSKLLWRLASSS